MLVADAGTGISAEQAPLASGVSDVERHLSYSAAKV
jgi:hypothetical protein